MAKTQLKPRRVPEPDPDDQAETEATAEELAAQSIADKELTSAMEIEELMGDPQLESGQCRVTRKGQTDTDFVHVERVPVSTMQPDLFDFIATRYGGGRYQLWFYVSTGKYYAKKRIDIDSRVGEGTFFKSQREPGPAGPSAIDKLAEKLSGNGGGNQELLLMFLKMMADQNANTMQLLTQSSQQTMTALSNMVAALKGGGEQRPAFDMLQALTVFNQLKAKDSSVDPLKLMEMAHNWFKENSADADEEPAWLKLIQALGPVLLGKMGVPVPNGAMPQLPDQTQTPETRPAPQPQPPAVSSIPTIEASTNASPNNEEEMNITFLLRMMRPKILAQIEAGAAPQDAVDLVSNPIVFTDAQYEKLEQILKTETWRKDLLGDDPLTPKQIAWLDEFRRLFFEEPKEP